MSHITLSEHTFRKGKFITPFNAIPHTMELPDDQSWFYGRMPEYLWIGLILKWFGRDSGLKILHLIAAKLHILAPELLTARISLITALPDDTQEKLYDYILSLMDKKALSPLTIFLTTTKAPIFAQKFHSDMSIEDRCEKLIETMRELADHQSNESTDIRYVALYYRLLSGKFHLPESQMKLIELYPITTHEDEIMRSIRPSIRVIEQMILVLADTSKEYLQMFWRCISEVTECASFSVVFPKETRDIASYMKGLKEIFQYLSNLYISTSPLDNKMTVIMGISTYSYKRLKEAYDHNLFNAISGRSCIRAMIENYIILKYLLKHESEHTDIWRDYQLYGLGQYKLVLERHREGNANAESHFDQTYIELLVNEFKDETYLDMDTKYFDNQNIRLKAESVEEKPLYGLYYDYDSAFEHGLWGAIRESSMLKCNNPTHQYHCIPDVEDMNRLKSVLADCVMIMNKTVSLLNELYGIPQSLLNEVLGFELQPIAQ